MRLGGLLLTGGSSRRMGRDKVTLPFGGLPLAARAAAALREAADVALAVGDDAGVGLETVEDPRDGPLAAVAAGVEALATHGPFDGVLVVAADMPFVSAPLLAYIADARAASDVALPVANGQDQPLCACYSPDAIAMARRLVAEGSRAMRDLIRALPRVARVSEQEWSVAAPPHALLDVDSPADLEVAVRILDSPA